MRVCSVPGCPTIYSGTDTRCPTHTKTADQAHWAKTRAYNTKGHRKVFRPGVLARDPVCVLCEMRMSTDADHYPRSRADLVELGLDANAPEYGRGLCHECHSKETARNPNQAGGWNARQ